MVEYRFGNLLALLISMQEVNECPRPLYKETGLQVYSSKWVDVRAPEGKVLRRSKT